MRKLTLNRDLSGKTASKGPGWDVERCCDLDAVEKWALELGASDRKFPKLKAGHHRSKHPSCSRHVLAVSVAKVRCGEILFISFIG